MSSLRSRYRSSQSTEERKQNDEENKRLNDEYEAKLAVYKKKLFGDNNIMFDSNIKPTGGNSFGSSYTYTQTCKLCTHVTVRVNKGNLYLCSGCYREWDPETNTIIKPNNPIRIGKARYNKKLVLPCDEEEPVVEPCPKVEKVTMSVVRMKPGQSFYCKATNTMYIVDSE